MRESYPCPSCSCTLKRDFSLRHRTHHRSPCTSLPREGFLSARASSALQGSAKTESQSEVTLHCRLNEYGSARKLDSTICALSPSPWVSAGPAGVRAAGLETPGQLTCAQVLIRSQSVVLFPGFYLLPPPPVLRRCLSSSLKQHLVHLKRAIGRPAASTLLSWQMEGIPHPII